MTTHSDISSNAFNYLDFLRNSVDPRTGQYTLSVDLPDLKANALSGPEVPLKLDFNPLNLRDSGYGAGWNLRLSQFVLASNMLSLHTGESFKVTGDGAEPSIKEKRLDTFRFFAEGNETWRVVHRSGLVEVLKAQGAPTRRVALPTEIYGPAGHAIKLTYTDFAGGDARLAKIEDSNGELLRILRDAAGVKVLLPPFDDLPESRFVMKLTGDRVTEVILPVAEQASWRLGYELIRGVLCLKDVKTPLGAHETVEYLDAGHPYPGTSGRPNLPRVTRHLVRPGPGLAVQETTYDYDHHNFLGSGSSINWEEDGLDQLYKVEHTYDYFSTAQHKVDGKTVRTVKRTYNRFHLQTEEETTQGKCVNTRVISYYAENKPFDQQPKQFQMPRSVQTTWSLAGDPTKLHQEVQLSEYDEHGNQTLEVRTDGVSTRTVFYNAEGEDGCPRDPDGFMRNIKEVIVSPATDAAGETALVTRYRYSQHPRLDGSPGNDWLTVSEESLYESAGEVQTLLNHSLRTYYETPDDPLLHGRPLRQVNALGGHTHSFDYRFGKTRHKLLDADSLHSEEAFTSHDGLEKLFTREQSLRSGQALLSHDENNVQVRFSYDSLRRVISETVAPGTGFEASRTFAWQLVSTDNQLPSHTVTDVKQVQIRTRYDGLGRVLAREQKSGAQWRVTYSATYDALGQLSEETRHDWLGKRQLSLTTRHAYDDWGQRCRSTGPDGVSLVSETTPFGDGGQLQHSWRESADTPPMVSLLTVTQYNRFGKIDWSERHDEECQRVGRQVFFYDGHGQCIRRDEELSEETRSTHYGYDARHRPVHTRLPDHTLVERGFAVHSRSELPTTLRVTPGNDTETTLVLGQQVFDGLDRLTSQTVGGRTERYEYDGDQMRLSRRITPAKHTIELFYEAHLSDEPKEIRVDGKSQTYGFDPLDALITSASNDAGTREYSYNAEGNLERESWSDSSGEAHETRYATSLLGLPLQRCDNAVETLYYYDDFGRLECMTQGRLQADFEYDTAGRQYRTTTRDLDSGDSLVSENTYDSLDRLRVRSLLLNASPPWTICHTWSDDDQLLSRHLQLDGRSLLLEDYVYDMRGRLVEHHCSGERLPTDRYGNAITDQMFRFDALDNLRQCLTSFANGEENLARFTYADDDSCQLIEVKNSWEEGGYPASQTFAYDDDGNQLNDEEGRRLRYDAQGRLLEVSSADGSESLVSYRYDGHRHLLGARIGDQAQTLRFYQGDHLSHTVQDGVQTHAFSHAGQPLGQQQPGEHERTLLLLTDASPSVIGASLAAGLREVIYSAYGELADEQRLESLMGFNGELCEVATGWYLLGRGYRAYNPGLMRFHSPDSRSPFLDGGLNPYMYCLGNPIRFRDPTGHRPQQRTTRDDPIYIDPPPPPAKPSFLEKWLPAAGAIIALGFAATMVPWSAAISIPLIVGILGLGVSAAGAAMVVVGTLQEDQDMLNLGMVVGLGGTAISGVGMGLDKMVPKGTWGFPPPKQPPGGLQDLAPDVPKMPLKDNAPQSGPLSGSPVTTPRSVRSHSIAGNDDPAGVSAPASKSVRAPSTRSSLSSQGSSAPSGSGSATPQQAEPGPPPQPKAEIPTLPMPSIRHNTSTTPKNQGYAGGLHH